MDEPAKWQGTVHKLVVRRVGERGGREGGSGYRVEVEGAEEIRERDKRGR